MRKSTATLEAKKKHTGQQLHQRKDGRMVVNTAVGVSTFLFSFFLLIKKMQAVYTKSLLFPSI